MSFSSPKNKADVDTNQAASQSPGKKGKDKGQAVSQANLWLRQAGLCRIYWKEQKNEPRNSDNYVFALRMNTKNKYKTGIIKFLQIIRKVTVQGGDELGQRQ